MLGSLLFGIATVRARTLPRWGRLSLLSTPRWVLLLRCCLMTFNGWGQSPWRWVWPGWGMRSFLNGAIQSRSIGTETESGCAYHLHNPSLIIWFSLTRTKLDPENNLLKNQLEGTCESHPLHPIWPTRSAAPGRHPQTCPARPRSAGQSSCHHRPIGDIIMRSFNIPVAGIFPVSSGTVLCPNRPPSRLTSTNH